MRDFRTAIGGWFLVLLAIHLVACSSDSGGPTNPPPAGDPLVVDDLAVVGGSPGSVDLAWTSPALADKAVISYEVRLAPYAQAESFPLTWTLATSPVDDPESGQPHRHTVEGLNPDEVYAFALRATTDGVVWSEFSDKVIGTAAEQWDTTAPEPVADLQFWASSGTSITVTWTPGGNDGPFGQATSHEIRYDTAPFDEEGWTQATPANETITANANPQRLQTTITGLEDGQTYHIGVKARDAAGNLSRLNEVLALTAGEARTWYVKVDGTGDVPTIEAACDTAGVHDQILVAPGHYTWTNQGTGDWFGLILVRRDQTGFTLRSEAGPHATILDAEGNGGVMILIAYNDITIEGFTFTGGYVMGDIEEGERYSGGGLTSHIADPVIRNCIFTGNSATEGGGVWFGSTSEPRLENCTIVNNTAILGGGVMLVNDTLHIQITNCTIANNTASVGGGGFMAYNTFFTLEDCLITGNWAGSRGGGVAVTTLQEGCRLTRCTIVDNEADLGSAIRIYGNTVLTVENSIIAFNRDGPAFSDELNGGLVMGCSNVFGHDEGVNFPGQYTDEGGNFAVDPLLCSLEEGTLHANSPCAPGNHPDGNECGLVGARPVDCGDLRQ